MWESQRRGGFIEGSGGCYGGGSGKGGRRKREIYRERSGGHYEKGNLPAYNIVGAVSSWFWEKGRILAV